MKLASPTRPPAGLNAVTVKDYRGGQDGEPVTLERFEEMARFNYGSTVIVLPPAGIATLESGLVAESPVKLGQALARLAYAQIDVAIRSEERGVGEGSVSRC